MWPSAAVAGVMLAGVVLGSGARLSGRDLQPSLAEFGGEKAVTRASRDSTMGFPFPVEIAEVAVRGGQVVRRGDLLVRARDDEVRYQRDLQKIQAETDLEVQKAQAMVAQARVELEAQEMARRRGGGSPIEEERARTTLRLREVELDIARLTLQQHRIQLQLREAQLERMSLRAPFDGRVDMVVCEVGEVKRDSEPIVKVVAVDPLIMDVPVPTARTIDPGLKEGDPAWVVLDVPGEPVVRTGRVTEVGAEADPASGTRRVRVEIPNPQQYPAGLTAYVRFDPPQGPWAARLTHMPARQ